MSFSRQEDSLSNGRVNQRARTRAALVDAANQLMTEGSAPSMPAAAERALVSVATAYRYFRTAEDLWADAVVYATSRFFDDDVLQATIEAAGDDVEARLEALVRVMQWALIDNSSFARQATKAGLDTWFAQQGTDAADLPTRPSVRVRWIAVALAPLRDRIADDQIDAIAQALGFVIGVEAVITLLDVLHLSAQAAKDRALVTAKWILRAGLAEATTTPTTPPTKKRR